MDENWKFNLNLHGKEKNGDLLIFKTFPQRKGNDCVVPCFTHKIVFGGEKIIDENLKSTQNGMKHPEISKKRAKDSKKWKGKILGAKKFEKKTNLEKQKEVLSLLKVAQNHVSGGRGGDVHGQTDQGQCSLLRQGATRKVKQDIHIKSLVAQNFIFRNPVVIYDLRKNLLGNKQQIIFLGGFLLFATWHIVPQKWQNGIRATWHICY